MSAATVKTEVAAALQFASQVAMLFPGAGSVVGTMLQLGPGAIELVSALMNMAAENRGPTEAEQAELDAHIASNSKRIHDAALAAAAAAGQH